MKRVVETGVLVATALLLGAASAHATHSNGVGPGKGSVSGTGEVTFLGLGDLSSSQIHFNADSTPSVDGSFGRFYADITGLGLGARFSGRIVCLDVAGNEARVGGVVTASNSPLVPPGTNTVGRVIDNGESNHSDPPDQFVGEVGTPAETCPLYAEPPQTVRKGNFVVHAPAPCSGASVAGCPETTEGEVRGPSQPLPDSVEEAGDDAAESVDDITESATETAKDVVGDLAGGTGDS
jgi:hypothetical protein